MMKTRAIKENAAGMQHCAEPPLPLFCVVLRQPPPPPLIPQHGLALLHHKLIFVQDYLIPTHFACRSSFKQEILWQNLLSII